MQFTVYSFLLLVSTVISAATAYYSKSDKQTGERKYLIPLMISIGIWSFFYFLSSVFTDTQTQEQIIKFVNLGATGAPVFFVLFVLQYTHNLPKLKAWHYALIFLIPGVTLVTGLTNELHHLSWEGTQAVQTAFAGKTLMIKYKIIPWIFIIYSYVILIFSLFILIRSTLNFPLRYSSQVRSIMIAVSIPVLSNFIYLFYTDAVKGVDITPITFSIAGLILLRGMRHQGLLKIKPLGRDFLFESMNDGVLFMDVRNQVIDYNKAASRILNIKLRSDPIHNNEQIIKYHPGLYNMCISDKNVFPGVQLSNDPLRYYHIEIHQLKDYWDAVIGKVVLIHDISEIIKTRDIVDRQKEELTNLNDQKDKIISIISHDLRSPFASIISLAELMNEEYDTFTDAEKKKFIGQIVSRTKITYDLLENLLQWTRSVTNQIAFDISPVMLAQVINDTVKIYHSQLEDKHIQLNIVPNDDIQPEIITNVQLLHTILRNLLTNAIKFTHENGHIEITYEYQENHYTVTVCDNGIGIPSSKLKKLLPSEEYFATYTTAGTKGETGTGLGLSLCKELVYKMGGKISIKSKVDQGTQISFTLPYKPKVRQS